MKHILKENRRDSLLDIAKGVGILLVVYAHINQGLSSKVIYMFHMPLFFFLSGAALNYSKVFSVGKKVKSLLQPYLLFSILSFIYWTLIEYRFRPSHSYPIFGGLWSDLDVRLQQLINLFLCIDIPSETFLYNAVLWFIPCLFVATLIYEQIKKHGCGAWGALLCIAFYILFNFLQWNLPFCLNRAFLYVPVIWFGDFLYIKLCNFLNKDKSLICLLGVFLLFGAYMSYMYMPAGWGCILFYVTALTGIYVVFVFCKWARTWENGIFQYLGRASLIIMCIHEPIKRIILQALKALIGQDLELLRKDMTFCLLAMLLTIAICIPFIYIINKHFPFMIGKKTVN